MREYYKENQEQHRYRSWSRLGGAATFEEYWDWILSCTTCAVCNVFLPDTKDRMVDHDHDTGDVRGILCSKCNQAEGLLGSAENVKSLLNYLEK